MKDKHKMLLWKTLTLKRCIEKKRPVNKNRKYQNLGRNIAVMFQADVG